MKKYTIFLLLLCFVAPVWAQFDEDEDYILEDTVALADSIPAHLPWPQNVQARLDSLLADPLLETTQLGLMVWDLTADSALYCHHHRHSMRPASTMKLVTAITALDHLPSDHVLTTSLYRKGEIAGATFTGDLYVVGGMDPLFDIGDLRDFVYELRHLGIDTLKGRLVADVSMKDTLRWGEGWCWDDKNPTLSPLLVGKKANFLERFAAELRRSGMVTDSMTLDTGRRPGGAVMLISCQHTIDQLLLPMMKESDNLAAEALFYQLAACYGNRPARAIHARTLEKQLATHLGLDTRNFRFADGCGLSLYNYVSPQLLVALLRHAWLKPHIYSHLLPSLPIAGIDGTLEKRMCRTAAQENVRAKTGTLTGIISLAGYCTAANDHQLCFAIINQGVLHAGSARAFQDRVCVALCQP